VLKIQKTACGFTAQAVFSFDDPQQARVSSEAPRCGPSCRLITNFHSTVNRRPSLGCDLPPLRSLAPVISLEFAKGIFPRKRLRVVMNPKGPGRSGADQPVTADGVLIGT